jgi:hypothetical protein
MPDLLQEGLDTIGLLGSQIISNDDFVFISSNGNNIFNGMIMVYNKDIIDDKLVYNSTIYSPEPFNTNFGVKTAVSSNILAVSAISYNKYDGIVYIYYLLKARWLYREKIEIFNSKQLYGFGANLHLLKDNTLYVTTFYNELYEFKFNVRENKYIGGLINFENTGADNFIVSDKYDNLFISSLTNIITVMNNRLEQQLFSFTPSLECFYGSHLFISNNELYVACSLYYPFQNMPEVINNKVFVYDILYYNTYDVKSIELKQTINAPPDDIYFGTDLYFKGSSLIIAGNNQVYGYTRKNEWINNEVIKMPDSFVNYDYKVHIVDKYYIIGNYGYNDLVGAVFMSPILDVQIDVDINSNDLISSNAQAKVFYVLILIIAGMIISLLTTILCYLFVALFSLPNNDKKKKKEEEDSPYKVYSYKGYVETDEVVYPQMPIINPHYYNFPFNYAYQPQVVYPYPYQNQYYYYKNYYNHENNDNHEKHDKNKKDEENVSQEKVVSYKGYLYESAYNRYKEKVVSHKGYLYDSIQDRYKGKIKPILDDINKRNDNDNDSNSSSTSNNDSNSNADNDTA